jgi:hypothetical protein
MHYRNSLVTCSHVSFLPFQKFDVETVSLLIGPLKLARKYQADALQNRIVSYLESNFPTTLDAWDQLAYRAIKPERGSSQLETASHGQLPAENLALDFIPDPVSFISFARECDLPKVLAPIFYSLCRDSIARKRILPLMKREDLEALLVGKERMMNFICGPVGMPVGIEGWVTDPEVNRPWGIYCADRKCYSPVFRAWSSMLQDILRNGDPLRTFWVTALEYREDISLGFEGEYGHDYRDEMCGCCKGLIADKLDSLRQDLFSQLPNFFLA